MGFIQTTLGMNTLQEALQPEASATQITWPAFTAWPESPSRTEWPLPARSSDLGFLTGTLQSSW